MTILPTVTIAAVDGLHEHDCKKENNMQDRINTLQKLCGLEVTVRKEKGENVFEFKHNGQTVKTIFTYDKAKLFAEGIQYGSSCTKDNMNYTICKICDHFVDENPCYEDDPTLFKFVHLEDGEQEFDHNAEPGETRKNWQDLRPDLFTKYPDGKIGPNSQFHSRIGKEETQFEVLNNLFENYNFEPDVVNGLNGWEHYAPNAYKRVFFLEDAPHSRKATFFVEFLPKSTQVIKMEIA
jgi:hypothetical protein